MNSTPEMIYILQATTSDGTVTRPAPFASVKSAKRLAEGVAKTRLTWQETNEGDDLAAEHDGTTFMILSELLRP